jgi:hypothetical protein
MGVETPMLPIAMTARPTKKGAPRRESLRLKKNCRFSWFGCEPDRFMYVSTEQKIV